MSVYFVEYLGVTRTSGRVCQCASVEILESMSLCRACGSRSTVFVQPYAGQLHKLWDVQRGTWPVHKGCCAIATAPVPSSTPRARSAPHTSEATRRHSTSSCCFSAPQLKMLRNRSSQIRICRLRRTRPIIRRERRATTQWRMPRMPRLRTARGGAARNGLRSACSAWIRGRASKP